MLRPILLIGLTLALAPGALQGQGAGGPFYACIVPDVGAVYMIKRTGTPAACVAPAHIEVSWTEGGAGVTTHGALTGLTADDHPQYALTSGSRPFENLLTTGGANIAGRYIFTADGWLQATGSLGTGALLNSNPGTRFQWWGGRGAIRAGTVSGNQWDSRMGQNSAAFGLDTRAFGENTFAAGNQTEASGLHATALGSMTVASGLAAFAAGNSAQATQDAAVALGDHAIASADVAIALGLEVTASAPLAVAIGSNSVASGHSAVAIGSDNVASGASTVAIGAGAQANAIGSMAFGYGARANALYSMALGESTFVAAGADHALAAGYRAVATWHGSFVWADDFLPFTFTSLTPNEFAVRAHGGARFVTATNAVGFPTAGVQLAGGGGSWSSLSDRNAKTDFADVDVDGVLDRVAALPIQTWRYLSQDSSIRHMGPIAQDFRAAFGLGEDERHITAVDVDGVTLAAVQGLARRLRATEARVAELERLVSELVGMRRAAASPRGSPQTPRSSPQ